MGLVPENYFTCPVTFAPLPPLSLFCSFPPAISNIAPDRQNVPAGSLRVSVEGSSFCDGSRSCGVVLVNGAIFQSLSWGHSKVVFVMPDLPQGGSATVQIVAGGQMSRGVDFSKPVPNINMLVAQGSWHLMDTRGGQTMWIAGVLNLGPINPAQVIIGGRFATGLTRTVDNGLNETSALASFNLSFTTPAGALC